MNIYETMQLSKLIEAVTSYLKDNYDDDNIDVVFTEEGDTLIVDIPGREDIVFN